eukprot:11585658-Karenia_brevis.AAC.1
MTPRIFRYDMLMNTSHNGTPGVNRQAYLCMGEIMPQRGRAYLFRILSICYNAMQDIPKGECSNWVTLCRDYMRKHYNPWRKDRIMSISTDARGIHWTNHVDRSSPGS